jgi:carboxyl-terminal processing protease
MRRGRSLSAVVSAIAVSALVGGLFGRQVLATDDRVPKGYDAFVSALSAIDANYAGESDQERLVYGSIRGMLGTLDPHSSFFDPREYAAMRERQEGRYYGLGITIASIDGNITAQGVFEGSPASRQGVRRGDIISRIEGQDAKGWTTEQAMRSLRGQKGTSVRIQIRRSGYADPIDLTVVRDEVHILTVPAHFMLDATTGYIQMRDFGENTDREVKSALKDLTSKGMTRLLFDIRNNPGGPLDQAIKVANEFLPRGKMIVYTRGRVSNSDQDYRSTDEGEFTGIPMVVLTNRSSASAAEIVSGSLQDHDRAYLVGETTFGKALVQSVYRIHGSAGLALTTAHYYTPSGRLIQRPWDTSFDEYLSYSMKDQDANKAHSPSDLKRTTAGRPVYSGGGVEPDRHIAGPVEGFNPTPFGRLLHGRQVFAHYAQKFTAEGDTRIAQTSSGRRLAGQNFEVDDAMLADFKEFLKSQRYRIDDSGFDKDKEFIRAMIRYDVDLALFGTSEARRRLLSADPQAQLAISLFPEAVKLAGLGKGTTPAN